MIDFLSQLDEVNKQLSKTEKSKFQSDIDDTQKLIDKLTDDYLKKDNESAQKKLNKIKEGKVNDDKKVVEKAKADAEHVAEVERNATNQAIQPNDQEEKNAGFNYTPPTNDGGEDVDILLKLTIVAEHRATMLPKMSPTTHLPLHHQQMSKVMVPKVRTMLTVGK